MKSNEMKPPVEVDPAQDEQNGKECKGSKEARKRQERKQTVVSSQTMVSSQNRRAVLRVESQLMVCHRQCEGRWRWGRERWEDCTNGPRRGGEGAAVGQRAERAVLIIRGPSSLKK